MGFLVVLLLLGVAMGGKGGGGDPKPPKPQDVHGFEYGPYTVQMVPKGKGWQWAIWWSSLYEFEAGLDQPKAPLADGMADTEVKAAKAAKDWADAQAEGGQPGAMTRRGVRVSADCSSIQVVNLEAWISHAAPRVRQAGAELTPGELMADSLLAAFPECTFDAATVTVSGRPWLEVEEGVGNIMEKFQQGKLDSVEPPEEAIAARLVGRSAPGRPGSAELVEFGGGAAAGGSTYLVVVVPHDNGVWWRALVWDNPWREGMPVQAFEKDTQAKAKALALAWAKAQGPQQANIGGN